MPFLFPRAAALAAGLLPALAAAAPLTLDAAVELAVRRSEAIRSARAAVAGATEAARAAGQMPDPMLGFGIENLPITGPERLSTTREGMTMKRIALSQEWVAADKRRLREAAARAALAREAAGVASTAAETRLQAALAFLDAHFAGEAAGLAETAERYAREAVDTTRARLAAGSGTAQEVLGLAAARGQAADEVADSRQQAASAALNLARWTGLPPAGLVPPALPPLPAEPGFVARHPAVVLKQREVEVARGEAALVAANRRPNWTWEVAYGQRTRSADLLSVGVSIPLPVAPHARQDRDTAARLALVDKAEAELAEAARAAEAEYRALASDARRLEERIRSYRSDVLAPAGQRVAVATAAFAGNQGALALVFDSRMAELEAGRRLLSLQRELAKAQAQLAFKPIAAEELP